MSNLNISSTPFSDVSVELLKKCDKMSGYFSDYNPKNVTEELLKELVQYSIENYHHSTYEDFSQYIFGGYYSSPCGCLGPQGYSECPCSLSYHRHGSRFKIALYIKENSIDVEQGKLESRQEMLANHKSMNEALGEMFKKV